MGNLETILIVMGALAVTGLCAVGFVGWWVNSTVETGKDELRESAEELHTRLEKQGEALTSMGSALHHARLEVARVHSQVGALRAELDSFVHGPPSLRAPVSPPKKPAEETR